MDPYSRRRAGNGGFAIAHANIHDIATKDHGTEKAVGTLRFAHPYALV
jgi:hypothetical protein